MAAFLQMVVLVCVIATRAQHVSSGPKVYSRVTQSGAPVAGQAQKVAVADANDHSKDSFDYVAHPQYHNAYEVADAESGDFHAHEERRDGDAVSGSYRLMDADGRLRTVHYVADKAGYRADVSYSAGHGPQIARPHTPKPYPHTSPRPQAIPEYGTPKTGDHVQSQIRVQHHRANHHAHIQHNARGLSHAQKLAEAHALAGVH